LADLTETAGPNLLQQIRLIAGLRFRILRNGLRGKNKQLDVLGTVLAAFFGALIIVGFSFVFFFGAYQCVLLGRYRWLGLLFWAIFIFWQFIPVFTAGFGAAFDFRKMLRFPLTLPAFYLIGLAYGFFDFSSIACICWLAAMTLGAAAGAPALFPAMLLICFLFLVVNLTLERTVGSWLERILARRRAREIFFALFILLIISVQFISPLVQRYGRSAAPGITLVLPYLNVFPASLAGRAMAGYAAHHFDELFLGAAGLCAYLLFFSILLWIRFAAQFRGEELGETAAPRTVARRTSSSAPPRDALRLLSPQVAAVLRKEFRYLTRNSFAFFLLIMPLAFVLLFSMQFAGRHPTALKHSLSPDLFFPGMMGYLILILMAPAYNCFAFDGRGIQTYFTSPLSFREVFLGKNLLQLTLSAFELAVAILAFSYLVGLPSWPVLLATLAAMVFVISGQLAIANWSSLSFPRRLNFGQMRGQRQSGMAGLVSFATQLLLGAICAPILFLSRWTHSPWLPLEVFTFLAAGAIAGYLSSLDPLAQFAERKKESLIEALSK
jgi:hypothetical protein